MPRRAGHKLPTTARHAALLLFCGAIYVDLSDKASIVTQNGMTKDPCADAIASYGKQNFNQFLSMITEHPQGENSAIMALDLP